MWLLSLILTSTAFAANPNPDPIIPTAIDPLMLEPVVNRSPAIDGPATEMPVGQNAHLYEFLEEVETDTQAWDYNSTHLHPSYDDSLQLGRITGQLDQP